MLQSYCGFELCEVVIKLICENLNCTSDCVAAQLLLIDKKQSFPVHFLIKVVRAKCGLAVLRVGL